MGHTTNNPSFPGRNTCATRWEGSGRRPKIFIESGSRTCTEYPSPRKSETPKSCAFFHQNAAPGDHQAMQAAWGRGPESGVEMLPSVSLDGWRRKGILTRCSPPVASLVFVSDTQKTSLSWKAGRIKLISQRPRGRLIALWETGPRRGVGDRPRESQSGRGQTCTQGLGFSGMGRKELNRRWALGGRLCSYKQ